MRLLARAWFLLFVTISITAQSKGDIPPDVLYSRSKNSVVTILTYDAKNLPTSQGSGFIVARNRVVTNYHVIAGSNSVSIIFGDGTTARTSAVIAASGPQDVVILEVETGGRLPLPMGDELQLKVGEPVYAIGAPSGLSGSLSNGLVSAFRQDEGQFLIQTTAPIAPGSSGGLLLNTRGDVIGITTSRLKEGGFAFAVGVSDVQRLLKVPLAAKVQPSDLPSNDPGTEPDELTAVNSLADQKKYPAALSQFKTLPSAARNSFDGQLLLCRIEEALPDYPQAVEACDIAISLRPGEPRPYALKAYALFASGQVTQAEQPALRSVQLSDDASFKAVLGLIYYAEEKYDLVPTCLSENEADAFTLGLLAGAALHDGDNDAFRRLYGKLHAVKGDNNGWYYYLEGGKSEKDLDFNSAITSYAKCDADDDFYDAICIVRLANAQTKIGDYKSAIATINSALARYPTNHSVLSEAIFVNLLTDKRAEAQRLHDVLRTLARLPQDSGTDCLFFYGIGQAATATSHCDSYLHDHQESHGAWSNSAWAAIDNGDYKTAAFYLSKAKDLLYEGHDKYTVAQDLDLSWAILVTVYYAGNKKDAKEIYKAIKKTYPDFTTMPELKQLPLVWSDNTQLLITKITLDLK